MASNRPQQRFRALIYSSTNSQTIPSLQELSLRALAKRGFFAVEAGQDDEWVVKAIRNNSPSCGDILTEAEWLLLEVVHGNQAVAEEMIKANPLLLLESASVIDYAGRVIEGTALQIALGAEDVRYHDNEECMAEMIQRYLSQLPNGEEVMAAQIKMQFPDGWEVQEAERAKRDSDMLRNVIEAIRQSQTNDEAESSIQAFRDYLEVENKGEDVVFKTGKHFNIQLLVEAFKLYDAFGGWDGRQNNLFWRNVIGYIQRFLPACYAQAFCQGVLYIVEGGEKLNRSLTFRFDRFDNAFVFFPLDSDPSFRLGFDCAMGAPNGSFRILPPARLATTYVKQKTSTLREFTQRLDNNHAKTQCVVM